MSATKTLRQLLIAALLAVSVIALAPSHASAQSPGSDVQDYIGRINQLRASLGIQPLQVEGNMTALAQQHTQEMANSGSLYHTGDLTAGVTSYWLKLGENVGYGPNNAKVWNAFVNSPGHYKNLTDPAFNRVGVAVVYANGVQWTTHRFLQVGAPAPTPAPAPAPAPAPGAAPAPAPRATPAPGSAGTPTPNANPAPTANAPAAPETPAAPVIEPSPAEPVRVAAVLDALRLV